jgi:hypothetical protein
MQCYDGKTLGGNAGHNLYMFKQKMMVQQNEEFGPGSFASGRDFAWTRQDTSDLMTPCGKIEKEDRVGFICRILNYSGPSLIY